MYSTPNLIILLAVITPVVLRGVAMATDVPLELPEEQTVREAQRELPHPVLQIPSPEQLRMLRMAFMPSGRGGALIGFADGKNRVFYKWKGVQVPVHWIWPPGAISGPGVLVPGDVETMLSIDPSLDYVINDAGRAEPGYYDGAFQRLYRWRGVQFDPQKVPAEWIGIKRDPNHEFFPFEIRDIDVPKHRREFAEQLQATVNQDREK